MKLNEDINTNYSIGSPNEEWKRKYGSEAVGNSDNLLCSGVEHDGDRAVSINAVKKVIRETKYSYADPLAYNYVVKLLNELPSVAPQRLMGYWIEGKYSDEDVRYNDSSYKCSNCGKRVDFKENFCPSCGTEMKDKEI